MAAEGEDSNERLIPGANEWDPPKIMIRPREQLTLTDKEKNTLGCNEVRDQDVKEEVEKLTL